MNKPTCPNCGENRAPDKFACYGCWVALPFEIKRSITLAMQTGNKQLLELATQRAMDDWRDSPGRAAMRTNSKTRCGRCSIRFAVHRLSKELGSPVCHACASDAAAMGAARRAGTWPP